MPPRPTTSTATCSPAYGGESPAPSGVLGAVAAIVVACGILPALTGPGQLTIMATYIPSSTDLVFRTLCLAPDRYRAILEVDGKEVSGTNCGPGGSTDAGTGRGSAREPGKGWPDIAVGGQHKVTLQLVDFGGRPATADQARLGFGIYRQGPSEVVDGTGVPRFVDANGYRYELRDLRTAAATSLKLTIDTPAGTPYLLSYGTSDDGGAGDVFMRLSETGAARGVLASGEDVSTVDGPRAQPERPPCE